MNEYQINKEKARNMAIQWQYNLDNGVLYSWGDIANIQATFERMARRYGLLKEFRENGII